MRWKPDLEALAFVLSKRYKPGMVSGSGSGSVLL